MNIELPSKVRNILDVLDAHGYEAYVVGGCVRDSILQRKPEDWDITTSARPEEVKALFGNGVLKPDGTMDRGKIAEKIFADNHLMDEMNSVVHPAVRRNVLERIENEPCGSLIVIESAILIESGYKDECDEIWYVFASRKTRTDRLIKTRGYSIDKIRSIMECQYDDSVFRENCDFVLNNDGSFEETEKIIDERVSNEILQYCQRKQR